MKRKIFGGSIIIVAVVTIVVVFCNPQEQVNLVTGVKYSEAQAGAILWALVSIYWGFYFFATKSKLKKKKPEVGNKTTPLSVEKNERVDIPEVFSIYENPNWPNDIYKNLAPENRLK